MLVLALLACGAPCLPTVGVALTVCPVDDVDRAPMPADSVAWSWPADSADYDGAHPLECADDDCLVWYLSEVTAGEIELEATRVDEGGSADDCASVWYQRTRLTLDENQRQVLDLPLTLGGGCATEG